jgi:hypothetical protein
MMTALQPALELNTGNIGSIGARKAARNEAQTPGFGPYCLFKGLAPIHPRRHNRMSWLSVGNSSASKGFGSIPE